jgi:hypothetical protein
MAVSGLRMAMPSQGNGDAALGLAARLLAPAVAP